MGDCLLFGLPISCINVCCKWITLPWLKIQIWCADVQTTHEKIPKFVTYLLQKFSLLLFSRHKSLLWKIWSHTQPNTGFVSRSLRSGKIKVKLRWNLGEIWLVVSVFFLLNWFLVSWISNKSLLERISWIKLRLFWSWIGLGAILTNCHWIWHWIWMSPGRLQTDFIRSHKINTNIWLSHDIGELTYSTVSFQKKVQAFDSTRTWKEQPVPGAARCCRNHQRGLQMRPALYACTTGGLACYRLPSRLTHKSEIQTHHHYDSNEHKKQI